MPVVYTALTFAPVQGFIEKSRKLRDLYGSSFILSHLAKSICESANSELGDGAVVSPALINVTQGTPNQIVIRGDFPKAKAKAALDRTWHQVVATCRRWMEQQVPGDYTWEREWQAWKDHAWEFFWGQGETISEARQAIQRAKQSRDWTGINWIGESSTLSGTDAIAWPGMGRMRCVADLHFGADDREIREFYQKLSEILGEAFGDESEQLSIPELVKRLVTYEAIAKPIGLQQEVPPTFREIGRTRSFWFQGDGDRIGKYLQELKNDENDESLALTRFSEAMLEWGAKTLKPAVDGKVGRIIYAGGDDFLGVLYEGDAQKTLSPREGLKWLEHFPELWRQHYQEITVSVGAVLASPQVPQRDVLQHCREAEKSAKKKGRDRLALRVLFGSGNHIEWVCPWGFLKPIFDGYRDRNGIQGEKANWGHFLNDVAALEARHAFAGNQTEVGLSLFAIYFGDANRQILETSPQEDLNNWIISLAKVGFQLCSDT